MIRPFLLAAAGALVAVAGCGSSTDPSAVPTPSGAGAATLTIQGWPPGQIGTARFYRNATVDAVLGEFPVSSAGVLTYALGVPRGLLPFAPTPGVSVAPADAGFQVVMATTTLLGGDAAEVGEIRMGTSPERPPRAGELLVQLWYVDRDVTVTGAADGCTYDQRFRAGWNYAVTHVTSLSPYACSHTASPELPAGAAWHHVLIGP